MGSKYVLNLGKTAPDFNSVFTKDGVWPSNIIFDKEAWAKEENHMPLVRDDENVDLSGNKGQYVMAKEFHLVVLVSKSDDQTLEQQMAGIPHMDKFRKI
mmetsp:Transcript_115315/g.160011  ORF Transcript_115315/g.160011 Transcript_115315/m.160011 type:complete len:99 (-) Transcript_115315:77-373(-)|eukprot:CAMPEP_0176371278 /NCGR_PEP_ID=MMETSP0126-20121128/24585_1 /TAXON_ID=141414 ORGANISM="Strombidinopsis acuminatum, Strain SPMC142" /NCGR_SAMPLE_ID=MMETSP0126 /ASSEMBLY_ACC=CAM_ASM_000229 /LENGTH=98 /DNA_ID=CAMNT_0017730669 /DNA_START=268 /DNA_END=564 /DNA_ORIENTATION=+